MGKKYRLGVVGVFVDKTGDKVLVCERSNGDGAWQFPQGGVDPGESVESALLREMSEELGISEFTVLQRSLDMTTYDFPKEASFKLAREFNGQQHFWFLLQFKGSETPNLALSDGEFKDWKWTSIAASLDGIVAWKRKAYEDGLKLLGLWN